MTSNNNTNTNENDDNLTFDMLIDSTSAMQPETNKVTKKKSSKKSKNDETSTLYNDNIDRITKMNDDSTEQKKNIDDVKPLNEIITNKDIWKLVGPPELNNKNTIREPVDLVSNFTDQKGKAILNDKQLAALKKSFETITQIALLPSIDELTKIGGIGEQTAMKIWSACRQFKRLNAKTAQTMYEQSNEILVCSTGSKNLDTLLGGGIKTKELTEFFGEPACGKTQICYTTAVLALLNKTDGGFLNYDPNSLDRPRVHWIDCEGVFNSKRIIEIVNKRFPDKNVEEFLKNIIVTQVTSTKLLETAIKEVFKSNDNIVLVILDSLIALPRAEYSHGISELARRQQFLQQIIGDLKANIMIRNCAVIYTNQVVTKMNMMGPVAITTIDAAGGPVVAHGSTHRIKLTKKSVSGKNKDLNLRKAVIVDSAYLQPGECEYQISKAGIQDVPQLGISTKKQETIISINDDEEETDLDIEHD